MSSLQEAWTLLQSAFEAANARYAIGGSWASTAFGEPRLTNDIDILAEMTPENLDRFLAKLGEACYFDSESALRSLKAGRPFNVIFIPLAFKFDIFPASAYPLADQELDRALHLAGTQLSREPLPFVTPEDILLAKLHWFRAGGEVSDVQWRDIQGIVRGRGDRLDLLYLKSGARTLGVPDLLSRALGRSE